uniref:Gag-pol polyprotein n=1 Tax=Gossypium raimondii TaxID=29730 RepID=A0A0D2R955_GOSRA|nr:hypothetical protein B456_010G168500 [Gossypium raimondii]
MLTTKFKALRMQDLENIGEFYAKLFDLSNQAFTFDKEYSNTKLVRKVLRSLPERFSIRVVAIEEAKDLECLKIDKLIGSLQTFEMNMNEVKCSNTKCDCNKGTSRIYYFAYSKFQRSL